MQGYQAKSQLGFPKVLRDGGRMLKRDGLYKEKERSPKWVKR